MSNWILVLQQARAALALALCGLLGSLVWALFLEHWLQQEQDQLAQQQNTLATQQAQLLAHYGNARYLEAHKAEFERLQDRGLLGAPERVTWVEQLLASHRRLRLPGTLSYRLQAPQAMPSVTPLAAGQLVDESQFHDLELALTGVHEVELLDLLNDLEAHVKARFRVNSCVLSEPSTSGLTVQCNLRFFTLATPAERKLPLLSP